MFAREHYEDSPLLVNKWTNVNPAGGMNRAHQHPNSLCSAGN